MKRILKEIIINILTEYGEKNNLPKRYWSEELDIKSIVDAIPLREVRDDERHTFMCELTNSRNSNIYRTSSDIIATETEIEWYAKGLMDSFLGTSMKQVNVYILKDGDYIPLKTIKP